jgi:hypothetical protein
MMNVEAAVIRGSQCSLSGGIYERKIAAVCRQLKSPHMTIPLCTHADNCLGGSGADIDVKLNWKSVGDVGIEAKRPTPDWMQMKLTKGPNGLWVGVANGKIPAESKRIFEQFIGGQVLYDGKTPSFLERKVTHVEWLGERGDFKDVYLDCASDTISKLYNAKGCQYIQVSGKGLFHTGTDVCGFGVPYFSCAQRIRIRIKVHTRSGKGGFASLSITAAAQPVNLKSVVASPYSLDNLEKVPLVLK